MSDESHAPEERKVSSLAELARSIEPGRELWPQIEARINAEHAPRAAAARERAGPRRPMLWPSLAAAAMVASVAVGVWIGRSVLPTPGSPAGTSSPASAARGSAGLLGGPTAFEAAYVSDPRYLRERIALIRDLEARLASLPPAARARDVTSEHGRTVVKVVLPHTGHHGDAELRVKVPKESEVDVSAVSAEVTTSGVLGEQRLSAVSGDITAEFAGDLEVKTVSGEVKLKGHGQPARLHVSSVSGDVRLEHGAGDLEAGTTSGSLVVSLDSARSVRARTTSGDLHFEGKLTRGADLDATSVSGDLKVRASAEAGYSYEARSVSGDITNCFAAQPVERQHGSGHTLEGTRGEGAGHVRLKTLSGEIQLCDRKSVV